MGEIRKDNLHESLIEELNELGNIDLSGKQDKTDESLLTESKDVIGAINELFQSANNGKELIASAIGEPVSAEDTFNAMSSDINSLLSTFKTNMMNNGITVESGDKFKQLIDKIATMVEEGSDKGVKFAEGVYSLNRVLSAKTTITVPLNVDFTPTIIFAILNEYTVGARGYVIDNVLATSFGKFTAFTDGGLAHSILITEITKESFKLTTNCKQQPSDGSTQITWYAIGVGEEDTTLRDSLASILQEEGVSVTEEDDMASLIGKVDSEFSKDNNTISEMETDAENTRSTLAGLMQEGGYDITGDEDIDILLDLLVLSGISVSEIKQIACGDNHTFILKTNGSVWSCGYNGWGQLGLGDDANRFIFTKVTTNINNDVKQIACGYNHTVILKNDGSVWSCGWNESGQLGLGTNTEYYITTFTKVTTNINNDVKQIACGYEHTFILKNDGSVYSCGYNEHGQLGLGTSDKTKTTFTKVTTNINNDVKQIACGAYYTFILKNDGSVYSCGYNYNGQLGLGASGTNVHNTFTQVTTNINNDVKQISCGGYHTFILKNDGGVWSCGYNEYGQLGLNDITTKTTFTKVTTNINNDVKQIVCGESYTFILKNDGSVWCCGYNDKGQLGSGDTTRRNTFTKVTNNINNDVKQMVCGNNHTFILKNDGILWSCGYNNNGQLGLGDTNTNYTFTLIPRGLY